jgi:hypothetical protein
VTDAETTALVERARLSVTLTLFAASRMVEAQATGDARVIAAADAVKQIAGTMHQISDDTVLRLATVNAISQGLLARLITARLAEVGFALPCCANAAEFFQPLVEQVDVIMHRARQRLN